MDGEVGQLAQQAGDLTCPRPTRAGVWQEGRLALRVRWVGGAIAALVMAGLVSAQSVRAEVQMQVLYKFGLAPNPSFPGCRLVEGNDGSFWGTSVYGGANDLGTVFKITPSGVLTQLFSFAGTNGVNPRGGLVQGSDGIFYGATAVGGKDFTGTPWSGYGTVFKITTNSLLTTLVSFDSTNSGPGGPLAQASNGDLYGTTYQGGYGHGTIFKVTTNGLLTTLFSFNGTNGSFPNPGLVFGGDGQLYGTTQWGGSNYTGGLTGYGTVFKITTNGLLTTLVYFDGTNGNPFAGLSKGNDGNLYGTTRFGCVFMVTTNGVLSTLAIFDGTEGWNLFSGVTQGGDGNWYGVTAYCCGGDYWTNYGTIYKVTTNGVLTTLVYLDGTNGLNPFSDMVLGSDGNLYGTMSDVARNRALDGNTGTIYRLVKQPVLTAQIETNSTVKLSWSSFTNGTYRVEHRPSVTAATWTALATNVPSAGSTTSITDTGGVATERYYRVVVLP